MFFYSYDALSSEERDQHVKKKKGEIWNLKLSVQSDYLQQQNILLANFLFNSKMKQYLAL